MGLSQSVPTGKIYIGKANVSAPGVLRIYNLKDNVFPYKIADDLDKFPKVHLDTQISKIEAKMRVNMNLSPRDTSISTEEEEIYNNVYRREVTAQKIICNGKKTHDLYYDPIEDKSQIYLCRQFVIELDDRIGEIKELRILQACCNYISRIPPSIGLLTNLKVLILSRNRLRSMPDEIGDLINLREINLSHNFLQSLPSSMGKLKLLNALHIDNNKFREMPQFVGNLGSLKYLNISHNPITEIPFRVFKLPFLIELTAEACPLKFKESFIKVDRLSLKEICCRHLIRNNLEVYKRTDVIVARYLLSVEECCFCGGPLFDSYFSITTKHTFEGQNYPVVYKMCESHYITHTNQLEHLYQERHKTFPYAVIIGETSQISSLFHKHFFLNQTSFNCFYVLKTKTALKNLFKQKRLIGINKITPPITANVTDEDE